MVYILVHNLFYHIIILPKEPSTGLHLLCFNIYNILVNVTIAEL